MRRFSLLILLLALSPALDAQGPSADWRTLESEHFRVHFPREYEAWAARAASRLESIRDVVSQETGYAPPQRVDVLVTNPVADPNGSAWPLLDAPRMIFFAEAPGPEEQIGAYGHWIDLLAVHEYAHLAHLMRPSRNPLERVLAQSVLPLAPITRNAPRWVTEGYATVVEGRLTGAGRPNSTLRALILRRWAQGGRLPTYAQLNSDRRFLGFSMAYLMGSAYLEWLEQRAGTGALRSLWARMTARQRRSFDEAFAGVFGERPDRLYGRFVAELTASAMAIDRARPEQVGELFQETSWTSGDPAVSPDSKQLAFVLRARFEPDRLVIWSTEPADEELKKYEKRLRKILARDPEDIAPLRVKPLSREKVHELTMPDGGDILTPRWTRDGKSLVFTHRIPDGQGFLHTDLFRWTPSTGARSRITREADIRDADPLPDGTNAIAVRSRHGATQLVMVNLLTGAVTPHSGASVDVVYTSPRASAEGKIAYIAHRQGRWEVNVNGAPISAPGDVSSAEWLTNETLIASIASAGFAELYQVSPDGVSPALTSSAGGAFDPAPSSDGRLFFTSLEPDGYVLRVLPTAAPTPAPAPAGAIPSDLVLVPAVPPPPPSNPPVLVARALPPPKKYGLGRQEWSWLSGVQYGPDQAALEAGVRLGDVVGRLDALAIASIARDDAPRGGALAVAWRGWPIVVETHLFHTDDESGVEARASWSRRFPRSRVTLEAGALSDDLVFASGAFSTRQLFGAARLEEGLRVEVDDEHTRAVASIAFRSGSWSAGAQYQRDEGATSVGGLASSILPRSAYARRILDPALPVAALRGESYDGWRIETTLPSMPFTAFYQRHQLDDSRLALVGIEAATSIDPFPILGLPGLDLTAGAARVLQGGETNWWLSMRWRP